MFLRFAVAFIEQSENLRFTHGRKKRLLKKQNTRGSPKLNIFFVFPLFPLLQVLDWSQPVVDHL